MEKNVNLDQTLRRINQVRFIDIHLHTQIKSNQNKIKKVTRPRRLGQQE